MASVPAFTPTAYLRCAHARLPTSSPSALAPIAWRFTYWLPVVRATNEHLRATRFPSVALSPAGSLVYPFAGFMVCDGHGARGISPRPGRGIGGLVVASARHLGKRVGWTLQHRLYYVARCLRCVLQTGPCDACLSPAPRTCILYAFQMFRLDALVGMASGARGLSPGAAAFHHFSSRTFGGGRDTSLVPRFSAGHLRCEQTLPKTRTPLPAGAATWACFGNALSPCVC